MATPIDTLKTQINLEHGIEYVRAHRVYGELFGSVTGVGWEWINGLYLAGGIWLIRQGVIDKRLPLAFIISLVLISNFFAVYDYSSSSSALFHTLSGGTMLAAFFIITDPVSASTTKRWLSDHEMMPLSSLSNARLRPALHSNRRRCCPS